jgi:hypothetical protein
MVSEDSDYGEDKAHLHDCLAREFASETKQKAELVPTLSKALKMLGVKVTAAEEKEEREIIRKLPDYVPDYAPVFWPLVLERVCQKESAFEYPLSMAQSVDYATDSLRIVFAPARGDVARLLIGMGVGRMLRDVFKELGYAPLKSVSVGTIAHDRNSPLWPSPASEDFTQV